jgi:DNA-binding CsgD family transcriptional regulator
VAALLEPALAVITIGTLTDSGDLVAAEVSGVAVRVPLEPGKTRARLRDDIGRRGEDPRVNTLRVRAANLARLGIKLSAEQRGRMVVGQLATLPGAEAITRGDLPRLWADLDVTGVIAAVVALGEPQAGRVMIVQIAPLEQHEIPEQLRAQSLAALVPALLRRTVLALGSERAEQTRWLTDREQAILDRLTLGMSVREIADAIGRSPHTVHDHVKSLHRKLKATSRGELIAKALGHIAVSNRVLPVTEPKPQITSHGATSAIEPKPQRSLPSLQRDTD